MTATARPRGVRRARVVVVVVGVLLVAAQVGVAVAAGDPYRPQQWFLDRVGAPTAWESTQGSGQVIAIVDSGVDLEHPDLVDRFVRTDDGEVLGRDFVDDDRVARDGHGHGTMVAGIAMSTRNNDEGGAGVAPRARLLPVRVLDDEGRGNEADVEDGIRWAVDNGATVVNLSLESAIEANGVGLPVGVSAPVEAVEYAWERGVAVVAAAGNSGSAFTDYPRSSPVVLVGSTDRDDERATFSDAGRSDILMAPGVDIVSTWCREDGDSRCHRGTHTYGQASGTSFSAPQVAAGLALLRDLGLDAEQAVDHLRGTARDLGPSGDDSQYGVGLMDLVAAVETTQEAAGTTEPRPDPSTSSPRDPSRTDDDGGGTPEPSTTSAPEETTESSPEPTSEPQPDTSPEPTEPQPSVTIIPAPSDPDLASGEGPGMDDRAPWMVVATLLVLATATLTGREFVRHQ